jgi:hypothetical protein
MSWNNWCKSQKSINTKNKFDSFTCMLLNSWWRRRNWSSVLWSCSSNWTKSAQSSSEDIELSSLPSCMNSIPVSHSFTLSRDIVISFLILRRLLVFRRNLFNNYFLTILIFIITLKTIVDVWKLLVISDEVHLKYDAIFTIGLIRQLKVWMYKTTVSKAVVNGLGTYSSPNIGNKLHCLLKMNPCNHLLSVGDNVCRLFLNCFNDVIYQLCAI